MRVVSAEAVASLVRDGDTIVIGGSGAGHAVPDGLIAALGRRFRADGAPRAITTVHPVGLGDRAERGLGHLAHDGLLKRVVCGTLVDSPAIATMASEDRIEAYTLPQGAISQLMREMAAGRPGLITHVGLKTMVDPRVGGGRQSPSAQEDLVEVVTLAGRGVAVLQAFPNQRGLLARHDSRRGRQRHHGTRSHLRRNAVDGRRRQGALAAWWRCRSNASPTAAPCRRNK